MPVGAGCTVCAHPQVAKVNEWLENSSVSRSSTAKRFDLHLDALRRHVNGDHKARVQDVLAGGALPSDGPAIPPDASPRDKLVIVSDWLEGRIATGRVRSDELREYRLTQKDIAEMDAETERTSSVSLAEVEGLEELLTLVAEALEPHPESRDRFVEQVRARGLDYF